MSEPAAPHTRRVLVTGGAGLLGRALPRELRKPAREGFTPPDEIRVYDPAAWRRGRRRSRVPGEIYLVTEFPALNFFDFMTPLVSPLGDDPNDSEAECLERTVDWFAAHGALASPALPLTE